MTELVISAMFGQETEDCALCTLVAPMLTHYYPTKRLDGQESSLRTIFPQCLFKLETGSAGTELMWKTDSTVAKIVCDDDSISCTDKMKEKQNNTDASIHSVAKRMM